ncbi:hypothetical protein EMMF5_005753 [Cystobasidiomycetes sp. EMM_F5]
MSMRTQQGYPGSKMASHYSGYVTPPTATVDDLLEIAHSLVSDTDNNPAMHTYEEFVQIIRSCRPELFERHPLVEELYTNRFRPALRQQYDSVESYLLDRLDWSRADVGQALATQRYFTRHIEPQFVRVRRNDWPYSVPHNFQENIGRHWLVWTLLPLLDWNKAAPFVAEHGIAGRTFPRKLANPATGTSPGDDDIEAEGNHTEPVCKEIVAFAAAQWPEATELLWLVNPVKLQSVPGLAHAHVFVKIP